MVVFDEGSERHAQRRRVLHQLARQTHMCKADALTQQQREVLTASLHCAFV